MGEPGGLVDRILKSAKDDSVAGAPGKVVRKKITLDDLKKVIEDYVQKTAGMGDPELRSRLVQNELQLGTLREQNASLQKSLTTAREGWKAAQEELANASRAQVGLSGDLEQDLAKARGEALEAHEELARAKGKLAALEMQAQEATAALTEVKEKAEKFAARLDEVRRSEKKLQNDIRTLEAEARAREEHHRRTVEALEDRIEELEAGFRYVEILDPVDWDALASRAVQLRERADALSEAASGPARTVLETLARRAERLHVEALGLGEAEQGDLEEIDHGDADFPTVLGVAERRRRAAALEAEIHFLETLARPFAPDDRS